MSPQDRIAALSTEQVQAARQVREELEDQGWEVIDGIGGLLSGQRVRNRGEQYPEAYVNGTAVTFAILRKGQHHEAIVVPDNPWFGRAATNWDVLNTHHASLDADSPLLDPRHLTSLPRQENHA